MPAAFWAMAFLMLPENQRHRQALLAEAEQAVATASAAAAAGAEHVRQDDGLSAQQQSVKQGGQQDGGQRGLPPMLSPAQQRGLVFLATDRRAQAAAAVAEALRLRCFR